MTAQGQPTTMAANAPIRHCRRPAEPGRISWA